MVKIILMGQILIDVLTLKEEGLVGFTENGEEVPLNAPKPMHSHSLIPEEFYKIKGEKQRQDYAKNKLDSDIQNLLKQLKDDEYIQRGSLGACNGLFITSYNLYTRRK